MDNQLQPALANIESQQSRACVVIPARMASTRLPGKMLLRETGRSLIEHTYEAATKALLPEQVVIATDHEDIAAEVSRFGGTALMTDPNHASGADRVAEVAQALTQFDLFINLQGDEPEIDPAAIDQVVSILRDDPQTPMATLAAPISDPEQINDPSNVKVVFDREGKALYFSRSPIPFVRDKAVAATEGLYYHHVGLYGYRREFLVELSSLPISPLEQAEKLEQLRVLEAGIDIRVGQIKVAAPGIDTPADYAAFVRRNYRRLAA